VPKWHVAKCNLKNTQDHMPKKLPRTAWKPGESGNPAGRPKTAFSVAEIREQIEKIFGPDEPFWVAVAKRAKQELDGTAEGPTTGAARLLSGKIAPDLKSTDVQVSGQDGGPLYIVIDGGATDAS
jgi:hypothetical protein